MSKILVVDDSKEICGLVKDALSGIPVQFRSALSVAECRGLLEKEDVDLFILDISLPDGDGFELMTQIRKNQRYKKSPVLFLSGNLDISAKISAFSLGADDFIVKPFNLLELRARVEARLKRLTEVSQEEATLTAGPLVLELAKQRVVIAESGESVSLSPTEFRILSYLVRRPEVIFSREQILTGIVEN